MTVAGRIGQYAKALSFEDLPDRVVHQAKRISMDAIGCCIGAFEADASTIVHGLLEELNCPGESTVIGSGLRTNCLNATLINGVMLRYLDYNDLYIAHAGTWYVGAHPSESIPGILAVGERMHSSGRDVITAIVLSYELSARFCQSATNPPLAKLGWNIDTRGAYIMPLVTGKLLKLSEEQLEHAVGISGCHGMILGILDTAAEEYSMSKNLRYPHTAHGGIFAALLAERGFTGPTTVIEGTDGFIETVMRGEFDIEKFTSPSDQFYIMNTEFKALCSVGAVQGHLQATLELVRTYDIKPEEVDHVTISAGTKTIEHTGDPAKKYPTNKETADHSSYYLTAIAIVDREVGPEQYQPWKYSDPMVLNLIDKVTLEIDREMDRLPRSGMTEIRTRDGKRYESRVNYPKGHLQNSMSDQELEDKFKSMASKFMANEQMEKVIQMIYQLESLEDVGDLMKQLIFNTKV